MPPSQASVPGVPRSSQVVGQMRPQEQRRAIPRCWAEPSSSFRLCTAVKTDTWPGEAAQLGQGSLASLAVHCPLTQISQCIEVSPEDWEVQLEVSLQPRFPTPTALAPSKLKIWLLRIMKQTFLQYPCTACFSGLYLCSLRNEKSRGNRIWSPFKRQQKVF